MSIQIPYRITAKFGNDCVGDNGIDEVRYLCPECVNRKGTPDTKGHLYVSTKTYKFCCHRCGYIGRVAYQAYNENKKYKEDKDTDLSELIGDISNFVDTSGTSSLLSIPIDKVTSSKNATNYLLERGFTLQQMGFYDMRVGNLCQEFGRIVIPNKVVDNVYTDMYSARTYIGQVPKYHNPSQVKKSEIVFNLHRIKENTPIILVEGALTAVAAGYHAVASLGKSLSKSQAAQIVSKHPSKIIVNYDFGAEQNSRDACKLLYECSPSTPIYQVFMPDDRDAADLTYEEYSDILNTMVKYDPLYDELNTFIERSE